MSKFKTLLTIALSLLFVEAQTNNIRQISSKDGLSNSAILSMYQTDDGTMWLGTCDGINLFLGEYYRKQQRGEQQYSMDSHKLWTRQIRQENKNTQIFQTVFGEVFYK